MLLPVRFFFQSIKRRIWDAYCETGGQSSKTRGHAPLLLSTESELASLNVVSVRPGQHYYQNSSACLHVHTALPKSPPWGD